MEKKLEQSEEEIEMEKLTRLDNKWVIWENWKSAKPKGHDKGDGKYLLNMQSVAEFDNLISFWKVWNSLPHSDPGNFFVDPQTSKQRQYSQRINK